MRIQKITDFLLGIIDTLESRSLPRGTASKSLNWLTEASKIVLRRGYAILGNELSGRGKITAIIRAKMSDGTERLYRTRGKKLEYYNLSTETWTEVGTDVLGSDADGKEISFAEYHASLAGDQLFINSPYGPFLKIVLTHPTDYADLYDSAKNYKGYILIKQNRMFLWGRKKDKTGLYGSKIDTLNYTTVSAENIGTGDGTTKTFSATLAFKGAGAKRNCFGIEATDTVETFEDNNDGTLTGNQGGTGTINYMTGAISVTFNTAPANTQAITCNYQWEDSTNGGIADFTKSATRVAGEGFTLRQDDGGNLQNVFSLGDEEYCIHEHKSWVLRLTSDDTNATNLIYREKVGIPSKNAGVATGEGIYIVNKGDEKDFEIQLMRYGEGIEKVLPYSISKQHIYQKKRVGIDLSGYLFNKAFMFEWGDYILCACRTSNSTENNRLIVYDKKQKTIDIADYYVNCLVEYGGTLIEGDPLLNNVYTLFSGFDDDESLIANYRELNEDNLGFEGLKKMKRLVIIGEIGPEQSIKVSASTDNSAFVDIETISGGGSYVDKTQSIAVGAVTIGKKEVGGGGKGVSAYRYVREFDPGLDKFNLIKLRFEAMGLGYASVTEIHYKDIRLKSRRLPAKYVS